VSEIHRGLYTYASSLGSIRPREASQAFTVILGLKVTRHDDGLITSQTIKTETDHSENTVSVIQ
jgi:hypothetical protein